MKYLRHQVGVAPNKQFQRGDFQQTTRQETGVHHQVAMIDSLYSTKCEASNEMSLHQEKHHHWRQGCYDRAALIMLYAIRLSVKACYARRYGRCSMP